MRLISNSANELYRNVVVLLSTVGESVSDTKELRNIELVLTNPYECLVTNKTDSKYGCEISYILAEIVGNFVGCNRLSYISQFSKFWLKISDDSETINSAYGHIIMHKHGFDQLEACLDELRSNPESRRAVININTPHYAGSNELSLSETKDEPCTVSLQFMIRRGSLHLTTYMRSNDIYLGFPNDIAYFCALQITAAASLGVEVGMYTHYVGSMHMYDRHVELATIEHKPKIVKFDIPKLKQESTFIYELTACGNVEVISDQPYSRDVKERIVEIAERYGIIELVEDCV